jgi:undecaprenyl-diphosphatase
MTIPLLEEVVLDLAQGVTELLPISSSGHLALVRMLFGGDVDLVPTAFVHVGTLSAAVLVVRKRAVSAIVEGVRGVVRPSLLKDTQGGRDAVAVLLATIPTLVVGLSLRAASEAWSSSPTLVGACFFGSALAIGSTYWAPVHEKDAPGHWGSVLVGALQGVAVLPGLSRSGVTIATLLWLGVRGERTFELSLLMWLPAIVGAELLGARHAVDGTGSGVTLVVGAFAAFLSGLAALHLLRAVLLRRLVAVFAVYLVPLGIATLAWGYARPLAP